MRSMDALYMLVLASYQSIYVCMMITKQGGNSEMTNNDKAHKFHGIV